MLNLETYKIETYHDQVHFVKGDVRYTMYSDGVFYSDDGNDIPQELFEMRDFIKMCNAK